jgi:Amt family ammonium transporter
MIGMLLTGFCFKSGKSSCKQTRGLSLRNYLIYAPIRCISSVSIFAFYFLLFFVVNKITPLRVTEEKELGLDISQHGEFL